MSAPPVYCGDRVTFTVDATEAHEGVVEAVELWRDCIEGLREVEARAFTARVDRDMAPHGGRARWARVLVRAGTGRAYLVEAPRFVVVESRAGLGPKQLTVEGGHDNNNGNDPAAAAGRG
jgi:hypothetical protein